jgi:hypothetical protein
MNTKNATFYHLILDKSGSMQSCYNETLSGLNEKFLSIKNTQLQNPEVPIYVSLTLFSNEAKTVFDYIPATELPVIGPSDYVLDGMTALCDAMGKVITKMKFQLNETIAKEDADAIVVVFTDGYENASQHYRYDEIGKLILELQKTGKWGFTFYGADIDAWQAASKMNFQQSSVFSSKSNEINETMLNMAHQLDDYIQKKKAFIKK